MTETGSIRDIMSSYPIQAVADFYKISYDTAFNIAGGILDRHHGRRQSVWYSRAMNRLTRETDHPNQVYSDLQFFVRKHILAQTVRPTVAPQPEA